MKPSGMPRKEYKALYRAAGRMHKANPDWRRKENIGLLVFLAAVVLVLGALRLFVAEPVLVDGPSMMPTLYDGDRLIMEKVSYWVREPKRGDIVICYYPGCKECRVKRVIGLPGETVAVIDGALYVDGEPLYEQGYWNGKIEGDDFAARVPERSAFVVGDNRNYSKDSRSPDVGSIPFEKISGRVAAVTWPLQSLRVIRPEVYGR